MEFLNLWRFVLLICILAEEIGCIQDCGSGQYYSEFVHDCVPCLDKCDDQDTHDVDRCKEACGRCSLYIL